jgi:predicted nucleic acid-binding protein
MTSFVALLDACVLYPNYLRDILIQLALTDLFRAKWTHLIHEEWMRNVLKNRPDLKMAQLEIVRDLMDKSVRDCLVREFEWLIPSLALPDPSDRHILAAAIASEANVIVTFNLKDFPDSVLSKYSIEAKHPDDFIVDIIDLNPLKVMAALETARMRFKNPPKTFDEYMEILVKQELSKSVTIFRELYSE